MGKVVNLDIRQLSKMAFYPTANGYICVAANRKQPKWGEGTCAHRQEFGRAAKTSAALRPHFQETMQHISDPGMYRRLSARLLKTLQQDTTHERGQRTVEAGNISNLAGFEFNKNVNFRRTFRASYEIQHDRQQGQAQVIIPAFRPASEITPPKNSTHFKIIATLHTADFDNDQYNSTCAISDTLSLQAPTVALNMALPFAKNNTHHHFISIGIIFIEIENAVEYTIKAGYQNPMSICKVFPKVATIAPLKEEAPIAIKVKPSLSTTPKINTHHPIILNERQHHKSIRKKYRSIISSKTKAPLAPPKRS
ncbi:hypothetical protein [Chitinophaga skermanii]|nr:hypothetical protein [Chitinophaga skermanii]